MRKSAALGATASSAFSQRLAPVVVWGLYIVLLTTTTVVSVVVWNNPIHRAVLAMGWGIVLLWVSLCGGLMWLFREPLRVWIRGLPGHASLKFFLGCLVLALLEEAITTSMTNMAPVFGVQRGQAYVTASTDYVDVIAFHSVVILIPMFAVWAWLLSRWRFTPMEVFLLFGVLGIYAEKHVSEFALWIFVYGLMVWLPAYALPARHDRPRPGPLAFVLALLLPLTSAAPVVYALLASGHPTVHFPPIDPSG
jgi:hypothetical protein